MTLLEPGARLLLRLGALAGGDQVERVGEVEILTRYRCAGALDEDPIRALDNQ